jgi:hypothetical protein
MLPDLRFAIGAVLASALLIVAAFGLAATVRVAHHQSAAPDDPWRTLAFTDPNDFGLVADRSPVTTVAKTEAPKVPPADLAVTMPVPDTTGATNRGEREPPAEPTAEAPGSSAVEVVAAIPQRATEPVQTPPPRKVETPSITDEPLEPSERVGVLPGFPTAGPGFVPLPLEHPVALPVPDPRGKVAGKPATKKRVARRRYRFGPWPLPAYTGYPVTGFPDIRFPATSNDKKWTVLGE